MTRNFSVAVFIFLIISQANYTNGEEGEGCGQSCTTPDDCPGVLICSNGKCIDDPNVVSPICGGGGEGECKSKGSMNGKNPPSEDACNTDIGVECCSASKTYPIFDCSPTVSSATPGILTLNDFSEGEYPSCDGRFHTKNEHVVALSTGWFDKRSRCGKMIKISGNGRSVMAKVVDECDSLHGCDDEHGYQPPCRNNIVDASAAVWKALGVPTNRQGDDLHITWSMSSSYSFLTLNHTHALSSAS
ncbi:hypothetical protein SUGI_0494950 [Cryptomeria japonica]|uniref:putative ripening-related protein 1 n=1 Tax=Cryptomeria japonica TaxID=3369 RepID=UPI0024089AF3|nr:putative ripening-related protein 1 [Cryptomeria japonica]GLJ25834.1 hypothetical protein SUGI_0494950 [Cryptomeria japonica]